MGPRQRYVSGFVGRPDVSHDLRGSGIGDIDDDEPGTLGRHEGMNSDSLYTERVARVDVSEVEAQNGVFADEPGFQGERQAVPADVEVRVIYNKIFLDLFYHSIIIYFHVSNAILSILYVIVFNHYLKSIKQ